MQPGEPIKYCLYSRKSSESDERQAMSIDSQIKEMQDEAIRDGIEIVEIKTESHSAKQSGQRKVFNEIIVDIKAGKYSGIMAWAPDRLSRNAGDLGSLVDLMDEGKLKSIRTKGQSFSNSPNEKFLLMILCSQAKLENDNRRENVKRGIRSKCESGWMPCLPPMGYYNRRLGSIKDIVIDEERAPIMIEMFRRVSNGESGRQIKEWFDQLNLKSRNNKNISYSMVYNSLKNPFYYGKFEYPKGSGKWYKGAHQPLITKDLFDIVQKQLEVPPRPPWGSKNFPFKRFLRCGNCGSSIVGEEKIMSPKKGGAKRHVYYHCSRQVDRSCRERSIKEPALVAELMKISDKLVVTKSFDNPELKKAYRQYREIIKSTNKNIKNEGILSEFTKYILRSKDNSLKGFLVQSFDSNIKVYESSLILDS